MLLYRISRVNGRERNQQVARMMKNKVQQQQRPRSADRRAISDRLWPDQLWYIPFQVGPAELSQSNPHVSSNIWSKKTAIVADTHSIQQSVCHTPVQPKGFIAMVDDLLFP